MEIYTAKPETVQRDWFVVDAAGQALGRLTTEIARHLRSKHKPECALHVDTGDYIVIINAEQVRVTGVKTTDKMYYYHSNFPGGIESVNFEKLIAKTPEHVIETAIEGMLSKNPLGRDMYRKLKMYKDASHPHAVQ